MYLLSLLTQKIKLFPLFFYYRVYDLCTYIYYRKYYTFYGWGIHLITGKFGQGKSSLATIQTYDLCVQYPQLHVLTNLKLTNFPKHTKILPLNTSQDILNAPDNTIILIDEIGSIFNSRDFSSGKAVPKSLYQHLLQCRKRHLMMFGTVQRFNLLDKQIRDISATVTTCSSSPKHPFTRCITSLVYDIDEYEAYTNNPLYVPRVSSAKVHIQSDRYRALYDTTQLIKGFLDKEYISDEEILRNRGDVSITPDGSKETLKSYKKRKKI